ncbi:MAG: arylsulfatase [Verrucomicrobiota bacterium]
MFRVWILVLCSLCVLPGAEHPNIVLILADDLGYGDLSCYNPESKVETRHLDKLAADGLLFTDAHSPSTVCTPTRYSILTGRMAFRNGMRGVFTGVGGPCLIEEGRLTLPQMLKNAGYETALFGKWHVGMTFYDEEGEPICENGLDAVRRVDYSRPISDGPVHRGFDHFFGTACCPTTDWLYAYIEGDLVPVPPVSLLDRSALPNHPYSFDCRGGLQAPDFDLEEVDLVFLEKTQAFLKEHAEKRKEQPFFLFHSMQAVHLPSFPAEQFKGKSGVGAHGDFIFQTDWIVGEIVKSLSENGFADNTLVIFTSDNGPEVGTTYHMRTDHGHDGARPWRGVKRDNWEGGHRVPTIVKWPGIVEAGRKTDQTICGTDIMATCAAIIGTALPHESAEDSFNMLPLLHGEAKEPIREFTLHQTIKLALSIRQGPWKYLDHKGSGGNRYENNKWLKDWIIADNAPDTPGQLYHLGDDPGERKNLVEEHPDIAAKLKTQLDAFVESGRSAPGRHSS